MKLVREARRFSAGSPHAVELVAGLALLDEAVVGDVDRAAEADVGAGLRGREHMSHTLCRAAQRTTIARSEGVSEAVLVAFLSSPFGGVHVCRP